jgi:hypothetical protein
MEMKMVKYELRAANLQATSAILNRISNDAGDGSVASSEEDQDDYHGQTQRDTFLDTSLDDLRL